jgi:uncharacterized membrane protein YkoI
VGRALERGEAERQLKKLAFALTVADQHANALGLCVVSSARATALVLLCAAAVATAAALVSASAPSARSDATPLVMPRSDVSMDQAVRMVEDRYHARVVKAQTEHEEGRTLYVLRLLNDAGRVWTVRVDAANGSVQ